MSDSAICLECGGNCCQGFLLSGSTPADAREILWLQEQVQKAGEAEDGRNLHKCTLHDLKTGLCTDYNNRPRACRDYPHEDSNTGFCALAAKRKKGNSIGGIFDSEEKAIAACTHDQMYIGELELNVSLGLEPCDWIGDVYYPRLETKEEAKKRGAGKVREWPLRKE